MQSLRADLTTRAKSPLQISCRVIGSSLQYSQPRAHGSAWGPSKAKGQYSASRAILPHHTN